MNIYVGNLPFSSTEDELRAKFETFGTVTNVRLIIDRETGRSRGFAFVEMADNKAGQDAIQGLNGATFGGRTLTVNEARPREDRPQQGFGGGRGGDRRGGFQR